MKLAKSCISIETVCACAADFALNIFDPFKLHVLGLVSVLHVRLRDFVSISWARTFEMACIQVNTPTPI